MTNPGAGAYGGGMDGPPRATAGPERAPNPAQHALDTAQRAVTELVADVFDALARIGDAAAGLLGSLAERGTAPRSADLAAVRDTILAELHRRPGLLHGAGLVMAEGALTDRPRHLEWWRVGQKPGAAPQQSKFDLNPDSEYFYDYSPMEWFAVPRDRNTRWVAGPYLDYTGVDLYVCTFAVPVHGPAGRFLGIAGADITLGAMDAALMPAMRAAGRPLALVNSEGRVIVANHADYVTGSRLRGAAVEAGRSVPGTRWTLADLSPGPDCP